MTGIPQLFRFPWNTSHDVENLLLSSSYIIEEEEDENSNYYVRIACQTHWADSMHKQFN